MNEKTVLGMFILSIVMIFIVISLLLFQGKITGKVIEEEKEFISSQHEASCSDSDSGKNYDIKGIVNYCGTDGICSAEEDSCSGKRAIEYYCENNERNREEKECESDCDDGKCISLVKKYTYPNSGGGGGGGGGGSSGGTAATVSGQIYDLGDLTSEKIVNLIKDESVKFKISGVEYTIAIKNVIQSQATVTINGRAEEFNLLVGEDRTLDLNQDNIPDIYSKIISINTATLRLKLILRPL